MDFLSQHVYPGWSEEEDINVNAIKERGFRRVAKEMSWLSRITPIPWIIGETSLSAEDYYAGIPETAVDDYPQHPPVITTGTELQQSDYARFSVDATRNCGASGYSWWQYQDLCAVWGNKSDVWCGLLSMCHQGNQDDEEKLVVDEVFRQFTPYYSSTGACPDDYVADYSLESTFYYPNLYPENSIGKVTLDLSDPDDLTPIKDAFAQAHVFVYNENIEDDEDGEFILFSTFSDQSGHIEIIPPNNHLPEYSNSVDNINVSAPRAERKNIGWGGKSEYKELDKGNTP